MLESIISTFLSTVKDVTPIIVLLFFFQYVVLKKPIRNLKKAIIGFAYVTIGLFLFVLGLEEGIFPIGEVMAKQLTAPEFVASALERTPEWQDYYWVYIFAADSRQQLPNPLLLSFQSRQKKCRGELSASGVYDLQLP